MEIRTVIIDDDPFIQKLLMDKLEQFVEDIRVVGKAENGTDGLHVIQQLRPDLVFLDVEMDDMTGFELLKRLPQIDFSTIFITSYTHYAIKAIRFNALDYLVKPLDLEELKQAVQRFREKRDKQAHQGEDVQRALINMEEPQIAEQYLTLNTQEGELRMKLGNIVRIEGERNYSFIYLGSGSRKLVSKTLGELEELLDDKSFFRCHKSHLVNYHHISDCVNKKTIVLSNEEEIPVARRKQDEFRDWYEDLKLRYPKPV